MADLRPSRLRSNLHTRSGGDGGRQDPIPSGPSAMPMRRRWGRISVGTGLVVVWIWGTVTAVSSAGDRSEVIAVAADIGRYEQIDRGDLEVVRVGGDERLATFPASQLDEVVGRVAAVDLAPGSLLVASQLVASGERVVGQGEALVGARLRPGELPADGVTPGADVVVVVRDASPAAATTGPSTIEVQGWLLSIEDADRATGDRSLSLVVPRSQAAAVTAAAADGRVSLAVVEA